MQFTSTVVVTAGGGDEKSISAAQNVHIEKYLAYDMVLPRAHVFVTNGGYNGVQQALSYGVPVVSGGTTEDKPMVSARVARTGAGIDLQTGTPTPEHIRNAVRDVLNNSAYRNRARILQKSFARYDAPNTVTDWRKRRLQNVLK